MGLTCHMTSVNRVSEEHQIAMWGLAFYLLENLEEQTTETELAPAVLQYTLSPVMTQGPPSRLRLALLQGLERLVVSRSVGGKVREQVTKVAVEQLHQPNPRVFLPALQLLLSCMYTGKCESVESSAEEGKETNPELLIQAMEKTSALFDRIKKGYPFEVELVCGVLPNLLTDFFPPSEILTRVIGEFLSTQQPHPRLMAAVVFQVQLVTSRNVTSRPSVRAGLPALSTRTAPTLGGAQSCQLHAVYACRDGNLVPHVFLHQRIDQSLAASHVSFNQTLPAQRTYSQVLDKVPTTLVRRSQSQEVPGARQGSHYTSQEVPGARQGSHYTRVRRSQVLDKVHTRVRRSQVLDKVHTRVRRSQVLDKVHTTLESGGPRILLYATKLDKPIRFPHVQSRIGRCDYEDRRLLCVAALVFYNQLTDETQKQTFVSTFQSSAHQSQHLLADLRACL
uniref:Uncharacterized protein n=1 Tax=Timema genevievae TaxID=629358 RepID=A0A7R9JY55_TIMGE|nr:unnamed protein product [Timema genevievae]